MKTEKWITVLQNEGCAPRPYSGRGMYGKQCVSIVVSDWTHAALELADSDLPRGAKAIIRDACTDSMGLRTVVYWPGMAWPEDNAGQPQAAEEAASK